MRVSKFITDENPYTIKGGMYRQAQKENLRIIIQKDMLERRKLVTLTQTSYQGAFVRKGHYVQRYMNS